MSENSQNTVTAFPISGLRARDITIVNQEPLKGGIEEKYKVRGHIATDLPPKKISLVERVADEPRTNYYIEAWKAFKEAGLPVAPTVRKTSKGSILMTDFTADGSKLYGKSLWLDLVDGPATLDDNFVKIYDNHLEKIKTEIESIVLRANNAHIELPADDPFELIIHPDNSWQLVTLDLSMVRLNSSDDIANHESARLYLSWLSNIRGEYSK